MKILVTGGHGFIGNSLAFLLTLKGHDVSRRSRRTSLDMTNLDSLCDCLEWEQPDAIFHCAAHTGSLHYVKANAEEVFDDNVRMALNLYRAANVICPRVHIINPLSNCSYPGSAAQQYEAAWLDGEPHASVLPYAQAKRLLYTLSRCYTMKTSNFLVPNTFGGGDSPDPERAHALGGMIARMILAHRANEPRFEVWGTGTPVREWAYIDDVVEILSRAIEIDADLTWPVNIAQNHGVSIYDSAKAIKSIIGYRGDIWCNTDRADGAPIKILDDTQFRYYFPNFKFIDHAEALRRTIAHQKYWSHRP
jgi:GDP-L-fucose synthase